MNYKVDSEVGRFIFKTYSVSKDKRVICDTAKDVFSAIGNTEWYRTDGFKEIALKLMTEMSYHETAGILNRIRWQLEGGTPSRTLENIVKIEGREIDNKILKTSANILEANEFNSNGIPKSSENEYGLKKEEAKIEESLVVAAIQKINVNLPDKLKVSIENTGFYEKKIKL